VIENYLKAAVAMTVLLSVWSIVRGAYRRSIGRAGGRADDEGSLGCLAHCGRRVCGSDDPADCDGNRAECDGNRTDADFCTMTDTEDAARSVKGSAGGS